MESNSGVHCWGRVCQSTVDSWVRDLVWRSFKRILISGEVVRGEGGILDFIDCYLGFGVWSCKGGSMYWLLGRGEEEEDKGGGEGN